MKELTEVRHPDWQYVKECTVYLLNLAQSAAHHMMAMRAPRSEPKREKT